MAIVKPFVCLHPAAGHYEEVAALPYDVYDREEAKAAIFKKPHSFLNIDRPETQFPDEQDMYADCVYEKAASMLKEWQEEGILKEEKTACYFIYSLTMNGREQTGVVACSSVDDYLNDVVRKHEYTLEKKEEDRIHHVDTCSAQTGPIFLAYKSNKEISKLIKIIKQGPAEFDFVSEDGIHHKGWKCSDEGINKKIEEAFLKVDRTYIADGHHRCASAVKVALKRRSEFKGFTGKEEFNYFLSVLFDEEELKILPYNRILKELNGLSEEEFLNEIKNCFIVKESDKAVEPSHKGQLGMYLKDRWYILEEKEELVKDDCVEGLDVSYLQREVLEPVAGISDPKNDKRIEFSGGIRGVLELEKRCKKDAKAAFSMYPTSIEELLKVADAGKMMPPKSTWFEPKLRSGLFIHKF